MTRPTPTHAHAAGMLAALTKGHVCGRACTGTTHLGDGTMLRLRCPYTQLDLGNPTDRRIIQGLYASAARKAMAR